MEWAIVNKNGEIIRRDFSSEDDALKQRDREIYFGNYDYYDSIVTYLK